MADISDSARSGTELFGPGYRWALGYLAEMGLSEADFIEQYR